MTSSNGVRMRHRSRGPRPRYFADAQLDRFHVMLVALTQEVAVLRERLDTVERLAARSGVLTAAEIDAYEPDDHVVAERDAWRTEFIERVMRVVFDEAEQLREDGEQYATVDDVIDAVSGDAMKEE